METRWFGFSARWECPRSQCSVYLLTVRKFLPPGTAPGLVTVQAPPPPPCFGKSEWEMMMQNVVLELKHDLLF